MANPTEQTPPNVTNVTVSKVKPTKNQIKPKEARYNFIGKNYVIQKKRDAIKLLIESFFNVDYAVKQLGMHRRSFYRWKEKDSEFERACQEIREGVKDEAEILLQQRMRKDDTSAIIFYLKTQCKDRGYVEKTELEHSGTGIIPIINIIEKSVEEIKNGQKGDQSASKPKADGNPESSE